MAAPLRRPRTRSAPRCPPHATRRAPPPRPPRHGLTTLLQINREGRDGREGIAAQTATDLRWLTRACSRPIGGAPASDLPEKRSPEQVVQRLRVLRDFAVDWNP